MLQKKRDDALARRVHKRKRVESSNSLSNYSIHRRLSDDSGSEGHSRPTSSEGPASKKAHMMEMGKIGAFFSYIERHPRLPHVLSFYLQLFCNFLIVFAAAYIAYSFWATIIGDVDIQSEHAAAEILVEMAACARDYQENGCKVNRVPAMETMCNNWEKCMNRDPKKVGRARMSAHTFAEIFNSFVEPISYKAMVRNLSLHQDITTLANRHLTRGSDLLLRPDLRLRRYLKLCLLILPHQRSATTASAAAIVFPTPAYTAVYAQPFSDAFATSKYGVCAAGSSLHAVCAELARTAAFRLGGDREA